jgi:hypothetical protein
LTNENITPRVQEFLPLALFVFFLSYVAFEAIHLVHSPGWNWRRTAKGCLEAFAFVLISVSAGCGSHLFGESDGRSPGLRHAGRGCDQALLGLCSPSPATTLLEWATMEADEQSKVVEAHALIGVTSSIRVHPRNP